MARRSGNPSRLASPNFRAIGRGGLKLVSNTRSEDPEGNKEDVGNLTKFCKFRISILSMVSEHGPQLTLFSGLSFRSNLKCGSAIHRSPGLLHTRTPFLNPESVDNEQRGSCWL